MKKEVDIGASGGHFLRGSIMKQGVQGKPIRLHRLGSEFPFHHGKGVVDAVVTTGSWDVPRG
jgi:hypothetical protein